MFTETGKTLGGKFRAYWESHGGLAQQGYPISDEFQEKSDARRQDLHGAVFRARRVRAAPGEPGALRRAAGPAGHLSSTRAKTDLSFTDSTGTKVTLAARPQRIVCLVSLCEDILFELGLEPVAVSDKFYQLPEFWGPGKTFPAITGGFGAPNLEDIAKAKPDLVIGFIPHIGLRDALKPIAPLFIMNPAKYQDSMGYLRTMGRLTDRTYQAEQAVQRVPDARWRPTRPSRPTTRCR